MSFNNEVFDYLAEISSAAISLSRMIDCDLKPEAVHKVTITLLELEQSTADFITDMNISAIGVKSCRARFIRANQTAIRHLEKIQLQGYNFEELITALKLECETLRKELSFS